MTDTFQTRIPALSEAELRQYLKRHLEYRTEAVEAALAELDRRGLALSGEERAQIQTGLARRDLASRAHLDRSFVTGLGGTLEARLRRIRQITAGLLAGGLGAAVILYVAAAPKGANPLGYEPEDTKKYLRDLELYGGKVNVLATEFMRWWNDLWHGRNLAITVAWLTFFTAFLFWFIATRRARYLEESTDSSRRDLP
jgi:hypothetical protein